MSEPIKLIVKNSRKNSSYRDNHSQQSSASTLLPHINHLREPIEQPPLSLLSQRVKKLQGNLKMLQKQYRVNLKQGFDNKIKAYRIQAVFQRKVQKQAIKYVQKSQQKQILHERQKETQRNNSLFNSRISIMQIHRQKRQKYLRQKNLQDKRGLSVQILEDRVSLEKRNKQLHDKVIQEEGNINKKRDYLDYLRRVACKKQQECLKTELLQSIISKSQKLKQIKRTLEEMSSSYGPNSKTFLTI